MYSSRYLKTSGQIYWADSQLSAAYVDNYHHGLDTALDTKVKGSEMITEIYVQRGNLAAFMEAARTALRERRANVIYGTVRVIEKDDETVLAWARDRYACVIFNLHIDHTPQAIDAAADAFRALIDLGLEHGGSYYLTYHRWARRGSGRARASPDARVPRAEAPPRSGRSVSKQLVPPLQGDVWNGVRKDYVFIPLMKRKPPHLLLC